MSYRDPIYWVQWFLLILLVVFALNLMGHLLGWYT